VNKTISGRTELNTTTTIEICHECYGRGKMKHLIDSPTDPFVDFKCDFCNGSGRIMKTVSIATEVKPFEEEK
jgi:DnaJ-class molecular chaperone